MVTDGELTEVAQWGASLDDAADAVARAMLVRAEAASVALSAWTGPHARTFRSRIDAEQADAAALSRALREAADAVGAARARVIEGVFVADGSA
ncbi:MAG: hypothetical protein AAF467_25755 [Actinomycetota bacterium]